MQEKKPPDKQEQRRIWLRHYEHRSEPLATPTTFLLRLAAHVGVALALVGGALALGSVGYRATEHMPWLDATLNAAMILGGMGPVNELHTSAGKIFAIFYSLFSGIMFLVAAGVMIAPAAHRLLHRLHLEDDSRD